MPWRVIAAAGLAGGLGGAVAEFLEAPGYITYLWLAAVVIAVVLLSRDRNSPRSTERLRESGEDH